MEEILRGTSSCASQAQANLSGSNPDPIASYQGRICAQGLADGELFQRVRISDIANAAVLQSRRELNEGMALAGALDMQSPAPARANRIGMSSAASDNRVALGLNYTRRQQS